MAQDYEYDWENWQENFDKSIQDQRNNINTISKGGYVPDFVGSPWQTPEQQQYLNDKNTANGDREYLRGRDAMFDAQQAQREGRIRDAMGSVNSIFSGRTPMYQQFADDTFDLSKFSLDDEQKLNTRQLMFSLARNGLTGGSTDIDKGVDLGNKYAFGLQTARSQADSAGDSLRQQDQSLKSQLLGLASTGAIGGSEIGTIASDSLAGVNTTPSSMQNSGQFYQGLYDKIGTAGGIPQGSTSGGGYNPYASSGGSSTYRPTSGGNTYSGTVS